MMNRFLLSLGLMALLTVPTPALMQAHNYAANGVCTDAVCTDPYEPAPLADGFYQLGNAGQVEWFSAQVNLGGDNMYLNAVLTADIDFTGVTHTPIGSTAGHKFNGRFNGQGHRILNLTLQSTADLQGFFGGLRGGGTVVENLIMDKSCTISGRQRVGGIVAFAQTVIEGPIIIRNCINEATVTGTSTAVGGILGGSMSPHPVIYIQNCLNAGAVKGSGESAAIAGWCGDNSGSCIQDCYNTGTLSGMDASKRNLARFGTAVSFSNCYDMNPVSGASQGIDTEWMTDNPLLSGELCYRLNGSQSDPGWYQTLGQDSQPVPFSTHGTVYVSGSINCDGTLQSGGTTFSNTVGTTTVSGHDYQDGFCTICGTEQPGYYTTPRKVFIMAGQSNADGRPAISTMPQYIQDLATNGGSKYCFWSYCNGTEASWNKFGGTFSPYMPYTDNNALTRCGFDGIVYHLIENALQERFYVVKESRGGTAISPQCSSTGNLWWCCDSTWLSTASPRSGHSLALELCENLSLLIDNQLSRLQEGYRIECIMWHQGESDRTNSGDYKENLRTVVNYLRAYLVRKTGDASYASLPFIAGTINPNSTQYNATVSAATRALATEMENFYVVNMNDCQLGSDNLHFDAAGCQQCATRMFKQLQSLGLLSTDDKTAVHGVSSAAADDVIYDLSGRMAGADASRLKPGIYVQQGKKMLLK